MWSSGRWSTMYWLESSMDMRFEFKKRIPPGPLITNSAPKEIPTRYPRTLARRWEIITRFARALSRSRMLRTCSKAEGNENDILFALTQIKIDKASNIIFMTLVVWCSICSGWLFRRIAPSRFANRRFYRIYQFHQLNWILSARSSRCLRRNPLLLSWWSFRTFSDPF